MGIGIVREFLPGLVAGSPIVSGGDKFLYWVIGSSRLDCNEEVRHPSRLVPRRSETRTGNVRFDMSKSLKEREEFWADVRDILVRWSRNERIVILGDFNDWVGVQRDEYEKVSGKFGDLK
ncbi:hypothetical protein EVAR_45490_1 [Eumeta japonica]|uniref:Endonuclease/exonuclease/phosphatase domain-containing protein n=1 Tax=Eumeta variegata TaxID=151549 RepID=A0A4C1WHA2_EUMVA|nr:hypothetical protein EVAR_45490_1 [Eumeta japonica]